MKKANKLLTLLVLILLLASSLTVQARTNGNANASANGNANGSVNENKNENASTDTYTYTNTNTNSDVECLTNVPNTFQLNATNETAGEFCSPKLMNQLQLRQSIHTTTPNEKSVSLIDQLEFCDLNILKLVLLYVPELYEDYKSAIEDHLDLHTAIWEAKSALDLDSAADWLAYREAIADAKAEWRTSCSEIQVLRVELLEAVAAEDTETIVEIINKLYDYLLEHVAYDQFRLDTLNSMF